MMDPIFEIGLERLRVLPGLRRRDRPCGVSYAGGAAGGRAACGAAVEHGQGRPHRRGRLSEIGKEGSAAWPQGPLLCRWRENRQNRRKSARGPWPRALFCSGLGRQAVPAHGVPQDGLGVAAVHVQILRHQELRLGDAEALRTQGAEVLIAESRVVGAAGGADVV